MKKKSFLLYILLMFTLFFGFGANIYAEEKTSNNISNDDTIKSVKIKFDDPIDGTERFMIVENYNPYELQVYRYDDTSNKVIMKYDKAGKITSVSGNTYGVNYSVAFTLTVSDDGYIAKKGKYPSEVIYDTTSNYPETNIIFDNKNDNIVDVEHRDGLVTKPNGDKLYDDTKHLDVCSLVLPIFNWIKILVPILIILLSSMDFFKAVFANEDDAMKKAYGRLAKRLMIAVVMFLVPSLLEWLIKSVLPEIFDKWFLDMCPSLK